MFGVLHAIAVMTVPIFVDVSIERWQRLTGATARHADSGQPFMRIGNTPAVDTRG